MVSRSTVPCLFPLRSSQKCRRTLISNHQHRRQASELSNASDIANLQNEMLSRRGHYFADRIVPMPSRLLQATLADFLPPNHNSSKTPPAHLYPGYHLVYFPNPTRLSTLLPDGTDPLQSPGAPFHRRMWAGGSMTFSSDMIQLYGHAYHCNERITDVQVKGQGADQKIFVQISRKVFPGRFPHDPLLTNAIRNSPIRDPPKVEEARTLVFMRDDCQAVSVGKERSPIKILKPTHTPDFHHTLVPTPALLFRFSALSFNAHAIHLDKQYCRETEGHRNLLVHGPLSLVLMLDLLRGRLTRPNAQQKDRKLEQISYIEYRNVAPLYAEEEMKVCGRLREDGTDGRSWDVWIEGRDGGYAVKGLVKTVIVKEPVTNGVDADDAVKGLVRTLIVKEPLTDDVDGDASSGHALDNDSHKENPAAPGKRKRITASRQRYLDRSTTRHIPLPQSPEGDLEDVSAVGSKPASHQVGASVDAISTGDETVPDEAAFQKGLASVTDIPTGNETIPDSENAIEDDSASEMEKPAEEDHEGDNAPYYQR